MILLVDYGPGINIVNWLRFWKVILIIDYSSGK